MKMEKLLPIVMLLRRTEEGFPVDDVSSSFRWLLAMFVASHDGNGGGGMAMVLGFWERNGKERTRQTENLVQTSFLDTDAASSDGDGGARYGYRDVGGK